MSNSNGIEIKLSPAEWAIKEYRANPLFWLNSQKKGVGLLKSLSDFVILHGQAQEAEK